MAMPFRVSGSPEKRLSRDRGHGFVYVLGSIRAVERRTYVGWCVNLEQRLARHNSGRGARSTRGRIWLLLYAERYATRNEAMRREVTLKRDRKLRAALLAGLPGD